MKNFKIFLSLVLCFCALCTFSGCPKAYKEMVVRNEYEELEPLINFFDEDLGNVFAQAFGKDYKLVSEEDLASIEVFEILTYSETQEIKIGFAGALENPADQSKFAVVDITGMVFDSFEDFRYLTGLRAYSSVYNTNTDYSFLSYCKELESINISENSECRDYVFLKQLPKLEKFSFEQGIIDDISVLSELTSLKELELRSITTKIDPDYLWKETFDPETGKGYTIEELGYDETSITDISFVSNLTGLKSLTISSCLVRDIEPLSGLTNLNFLDLSYNGISDITPLSALPQLEYINLTQNVVSDLTPLSGLDPEKVDRVMLDLCESVTDWSTLDYLGNKVQGRPIVK